MEQSENGYDAAMGLLRPVDLAHQFTAVLPSKPHFPRVTHVLCKQGLGDLRHDTDGIPSALPVNEDDSRQPAGQPSRAGPQQLPLGNGHTAAWQHLHHPWGRGGGGVRISIT